MAILNVLGTVKKQGSGEYGDWFVVAETCTKRDGDTFEKRYMCSGKTSPREGQSVVVTGFLRDGVREHDGKHYADIKIQAATWYPLEGEQSERESAPAATVDDSDEIPFRSPERIHTVTRVDGHEHHRARRAIHI